MHWLPANNFKSLTSLLCLAFLCAEGIANAADDVPLGGRVALLVGNSDYQDFQLPGVSKSLDQVERAFQSLGFRVERKENLGEKELKAATQEFARSVPTNGVAVVYFAGLGAHAERFGKWYNLLRPVGEKIESDNDYRSRGLDVATFIEQLREEGGSRVNLVFLDACWDSPILPNKGNVKGGLKEFEVPADTMVFFAAESGKTLLPTNGDMTSPLSHALAKQAGQIEKSLRATGEAIAGNLGGAWFGGAADAGIGPQSPFPITEELREGKTPGEGFTNSLGMTFRWCPPGQFTMGSQDHAATETRDRKPVEVTLTSGFWMGEYEVTQREYKLVRGRDVAKDFTVHKNAPFWGVGDASGIEKDFCKRLNELEKKAKRLPDGWAYVVPTEAEWEYSCRAGSKSAYCFGDSPADLAQYGNFADKSLRRENPNYYWADQKADDGVGEALARVGSYLPNAWGLRDMHGNVAEVVADHLLPQLPGGKDPLARAKKDGVNQIRGGAWCSLARYCESSFRNAAPGTSKDNFIGFRLVLKKLQ